VSHAVLLDGHLREPGDVGRPGDVGPAMMAGAETMTLDHDLPVTSLRVATPIGHRATLRDLVVGAGAGMLDVVTAPAGFDVVVRRAVIRDPPAPKWSTRATSCSGSGRARGPARSCRRGRPRRTAEVSRL
jgi:hypothetical protein